MFSRPAFWVAVCLAAGLILWRASPCDASTAVIAFAGWFALTGIVWKWARRYLLPAFVCTVIAAGYAFGALALRTDAWIDTALVRVEDGHEHLFYVTVDGDPGARVEGVAFRAALHAVRDSTGTHPLGDALCRVFVAAKESDSALALRRGDRLALFGRLRAPKGIRNPGDFDYAAYLRVQGVLADLTVHAAENIERVGEDPPGVIVPAIEALRRAIGAALDRYVGGEEGNVLKGLLIGERGELREETREAFMATGTFHVLSVSGLHVAYIALILFGVLSPVLNRYIHSSFLITALLAYAVLAGGAPSILRAVIMAVLATTGMLLERRIDALNIIGGAACMLLVIEPAQLFTAGFQLSFAAAVGLAALQPRLRVLLVRGWIARKRPLRWGAELACASIAAQCATLPLTALYFERLSPAGIIANLLVVPASGVALGLAVLVACVSPLPWLAIFVGDASRVFVRMFLGVTMSMAAWPVASVPVPPFSAWESVVFYGTTVVVFRATSRAAFLRRILIVCVGWCAYILEPLGGDTMFAPGALTVAVLDVGQGDGIAIRFPNGRVMVVDAGPDRPQHLAALPVAAFLQRQGIRHIAALVVTHLHADHIGGAADLLRRVTVDTFYHGGQRTADARAKSLDSLANAQHLPMRRLRDGEMISLDTAVRIYVLHPDQHVVDSTGWTVDGNLNNGSVVLKLQYGATSVLLSGDLEREREEALSARYGDFLHSDILKVGHHGSKTSSTEIYLRAVRPLEAVISVGENRFGHPSQSVITRLINAGINVERTDESGAVLWRSDSRHWQQIKWK